MECRLVTQGYGLGSQGMVYSDMKAKHHQDLRQ